MLAALPEHPLLNSLRRYTPCSLTRNTHAGIFAHFKLSFTLLRIVNKWRKGWDSNPRSPFGETAFRERHNRPLCHPSKIKSLFLVITLSILSRLPVPQRGITLPKSDLIFYNNTINFIASACHLKGGSPFLFIRFQIISNTTSIIQPCPLSGYKSYCLAAPKPLQF